jgi:hypothetical protein
MNIIVYHTTHKSVIFRIIKPNRYDSDKIDEIHTLKNFIIDWANKMNVLTKDYTIKTGVTLIEVECTNPMFIPMLILSMPETLEQCIR